MNLEQLNKLRWAEQAVGRLVEECRRGGPLHAHHAKAATQVSRTGKCLLKAVADLHRAFDTPCAEKQPPT